MKSANQRFLDYSRELGLALTTSQLQAFSEFEEALYAANEVMNLTRVPREECWLRHFIDSLIFQDLLPIGASVLDIGTGPGFPAWPIACARPDIQVVAIDSSGKMNSFLSKNSLPNLKSLQVRAEEWKPQFAFDVVTGRAVAPLAIQVELSAPLTVLDGLVIPMRTLSERDQLPREVIGLQLKQIVERRLPDTEVVRLFPVYRKVRQTPERYPRTWAEIRRKPLF